jgi:hypothetical protein
VIVGVVRDEAAAPVKDVRVYFTHAPVAIPDVAALTGADGKFMLGAPVDGSYTIECAAEGFDTVRRTVVITERDEEVEINLAPRIP